MEREFLEEMEYVGDIPEGWKWVKLGEVIELLYGKGLTEKERKNGIYPVYGSSGIIGYHNDYLVKGPGIIVGRKGSVGEINLSKTDFYPIDTTYYLKLKNDNDIFFFYYFLKTLRLNEINSHSAVPGLSREDVYSLYSPLPPLPEQKAIAEVLSSLDDKIDLLHRQNKTLEEMAMSLFRQWFIEPARDGLPEGWEIGKFEENLKIVYGKNLLTSKLKDSGYPVFGGNGKIGYYTEYMYEESQVLISCRGEASGKVNISDPKSYITNNSLILERAKNKNIAFEYLKYYCLNYDFTQFVTGSAQPQITIEELNNAEILIPPSILINKFSKIISNFETKIFSNKIQIQTLEKLRDTLLPKLMSGEVRIMNNE